MSCARVIAIVVALAAVLSCRDTTAPSQGIPASLAVVDGDRQRAEVGFYVLTPIAVQVRDAGGQPVRGNMLVFAERSETAGFVEVGRTTTAADGIGRFEWRLFNGATGDRVLRVRLAVHDTLVEAIVTATALVKAGTTILRVTEGGGSIPSVFRGASVMVPTFLVSSAGSPASGVRVRFIVGPKGGTVLPGEVVTGSDGIARPASWVVGSDTGLYSLTAALTDTSRATSALAFARVASGPAAGIVIVSGGDQLLVSRQTAAPFMFQVVDASGVGVPNAPVAVQLSGAAQPLATVTDSRGFGQVFFFTSGMTAGSYTIAVSSGNARTDSRLTIRPDPASIAFLAPSPDTRLDVDASGDTVRVMLRLADGSAAVGYSVAFNAFPYFGVQLSPELSLTDARGIATTILRLPRPGRFSVEARVANTAGITTAVSIIGSGALTFSAIAAGGGHSCGVVELLGASTHYCWGRNAFGQLGDGTTTSRTAPVLVIPVYSATARTVTYLGDYLSGVTTGENHSCVTAHRRLATSMGGTELLPVCWGSNSFGQLGTPGGDRAVPSVVGTGVRDVAAGTTHSCGLAGCWGDNSRGALGDGTTSSRTASAPVQFSPLSLPMRSISTGDGFSCAVNATGAVYCWGRNDHGQIGDGSAVDRLVPVAVAGGITFDPTQRIAVGAAHACARSVDGTAYCWGRNPSGQLGDGTLTGRSMPTRVNGAPQFASLAAGGSHTCGVTAVGGAYCWGSNDSGQLGIGSVSAAALVPQPVAGTLSVRSISAGRSHTCALEKSSTALSAAFCWGSNADGQLGDGTTTNRASPVPVAGYRP